MNHHPCNIHHVALRVGDVAYFVRFFEDVFDMRVYKTRGPEGNPDSVWLDGGVQLLDTRVDDPQSGTMDHVSFLVTDVEQTKKKAERYGAAPCPGKAAHWFCIPQGIAFELKTE